MRLNGETFQCNLFIFPLCLNHDIATRCARSMIERDRSDRSEGLGKAYHEENGA